MKLHVLGAAVPFIAMLGLAAISCAAFRGYLTADMLVYFISFKWCF
jgi:hypothetical protein